jgi:hypothetical protein
MNTMHFTEVDLKANREGRLSDAQRKRLNYEIDRMPWQPRHAGLLFALYTLILLLGSLAVLDPLFRQELLYMLSLKDIRSSLRLVFTLSVWLGLPMFWDWWIVRRYGQGHIHTMEGENAHAPWGKCSFEKVIRGNRPGKTVLISTKLRKRIRIKIMPVKIRGGWRWPEMSFLFCGEKPGFYFKPGHRYRVYYLLFYGMPHVLSAEEIEPEKTKR